MTFADWKLDLDSALNPDVTIDDAYDLVMKSVAPLGEEYSREIARYQTERWVDFAANEGKDSGGYAADPYRVHPYVLMSWTGRMSDVYTLIHEIGHSGQFIFSDNNQSYFNAHMSTYYVEAPSTFNELLLSDYLEHQFDDPRQKALCPSSPLDRYLLPQLHHPLARSSLPTQGLHLDRRRWHLRR